MKKTILMLLVAFIATASTAFVNDDFVDLKALTKRNVENYFSKLDDIKNNPANYSNTMFASIVNNLFYGDNLNSRQIVKIIDYTNNKHVPIRADVAIPNFAENAKNGKISNFSHQLAEDIFVLNEKGADNYRVMCAKYTVTYNGKTTDNYFKVVNGKIINVDFTPGIISNQNQPVASVQQSVQLTPVEIRHNAAYYYSHGDYNTAYQKYLEIVKAENDGDAYYRLAVMTYYGEGCKNLFARNKDRYKKAVDYLKCAVKYGDSKIRRNAENMLDNI